LKSIIEEPSRGNLEACKRLSS